MNKPIRKLAIVGASARAAAFSAIRAGYDVVAADLFADADLELCCPAARVERYPEGLADWLAACDCDAWLYTGALENYPELVDCMAASCRLLGNRGSALRDVRDPLNLQTVLKEAGVAFPETRASAKGLPRDGSWLCKTYRGASGAGVWRLEGSTAFDRADKEWAVFQRFVPGDSYAAIVAAYGSGSHILGVTRQLIGWDELKPWQYVGSIGPVSLGSEIDAQIALAAQRIVRAFDLRGLIGIDLVIADGRAWLIEVNPRYTASVEILERAAQASAIGLHVSACGDSPSPEAATDAAGSWRIDAPTSVHGKAIVFAAGAATIQPGFAKWAMAHAAHDSAWPQLADLPHAGEEILAGRPILTVFAAGATVDDCEQRLREQIAVVQSRLFDYRR